MGHIVIYYHVKVDNKSNKLFLIGIILRWGFLIWELIFIFIADFLSSPW